MKLESTVEKLSYALARVQKIASKNLSLPILENVLLVVKDNTLLVRSTNLHVGVEVTIPVKVSQPGELCVKYDIFSSIISNLKNEHKISLEQKDTTLVVTSEKSHMEINTYPHADFPTLPRVEEGLPISLPIQQVIEGVRSVAYAASNSDIKPEISSVYIYSENNELVFAATDSFRLAEKRIVVESNAELPGVIVPIKNILECVRIFGGVEGSVNILIGKNQISIESEGIYFTSRIIDGNYPAYQQIIPQDHQTQAIVLKDDFVQSLKLVNIFSDSFNQVSLNINKEDGLLSLQSRNTDVGENNTSIDAAVTGESVGTYCNHKYLSEALPSLHTDSLAFSFTEKNKPFIITSVGDKSFLYLIMPMNR